MKRSRRDKSGEPVLFDLPLQDELPAKPSAAVQDEAAADAGVGMDTEGGNLPLFDLGEVPPGARGEVPGSAPGDMAAPGSGVVAEANELEARTGAEGPDAACEIGSWPPASVSRDGSSAVFGAAAPLSARLVGGLADLVVHGGVVAVAIIGLAVMGIRPHLSLWPGLLVLLLAFSFLYTTVPLAFWGQTPGMALCHVRARDAEDRPLTFGQTALRWLGSVVTAGLLGLPLVLALSGRSLADRISGSWSYAQPADPS